MKLIQEIKDKTLDFKFEFFGGNSQGESDIPELKQDNYLPLQISLGGAHSCIITTESNLKC